MACPKLVAAFAPLRAAAVVPRGLPSTAPSAVLGLSHALRFQSTTAGRRGGPPKPVLGIIDESGADSEDIAAARSKFSVTGGGSGTGRSSTRLLKTSALPQDVTSLRANPFKLTAQLPKAAPMWMLYEAEREERPLEETGFRGAAKARVDSAPLRPPMRDALGRAYATGRRKEASARVWVGAGDGRVTVNGLDLVDYFHRQNDRTHLMEPLVVTQTCGAVDIMLTVRGGGMHGQAGAVRHGLANALALWDPYLKPALRRCELPRWCGVSDLVALSIPDCLCRPLSYRGCIECHACWRPSRACAALHAAPSRPFPSRLLLPHDLRCSQADPARPPHGGAQEARPQEGAQAVPVDQAMRPMQPLRSGLAPAGCTADAAPPQWIPLPCPPSLNACSTTTALVVASVAPHGCRNRTLRDGFACFTIGI